MTTPAKAPYVYQEYPKWVSKDGKKFIVQNEQEYLRHFPPAPPPPPPVVSAPEAPQAPETAPDKATDPEAPAAASVAPEVPNALLEGSAQTPQATPDAGSQASPQTERRARRSGSSTASPPK